MSLAVFLTFFCDGFWYIWLGIVLPDELVRHGRDEEADYIVFDEFAVPFVALSTVIQVS